LYNKAVSGVFFENNQGGSIDQQPVRKNGFWS